MPDVPLGPLKRKTPWARSGNKRIRSLIENLAAYDMQWIGGKLFTLIDRKRTKDDRFAYDAEIRSIFKEMAIDLVIYFGLNDGQLGLKLKAFYPGEILSCRPVSSAFERLAVKAFSGRNWHMRTCSSGRQGANQTINVSDETVCRPLREASEHCAKCSAEGTIDAEEEKVSVHSIGEVLDEIVPGIESKRIFLKTDIRANDTEVLKGLGNKLECVMAVQTKVSLVPTYDERIPSWTESISAYERNGFGVLGMYPSHRDSGRINEYVCLLMRV